jgi:hypothetical protein
LVAANVTVLTPLAVTGKTVTGSQVVGPSVRVYWSTYVPEAGQLKRRFPPVMLAAKAGEETV